MQELEVKLEKIEKTSPPLGFITLILGYAGFIQAFCNVKSLPLITDQRWEELFRLLDQSAKRTFSRLYQVPMAEHFLMYREELVLEFGYLTTIDLITRRMSFDNGYHPGVELAASQPGLLDMMFEIGRAIDGFYEYEFER